MNGALILTLSFTPKLLLSGTLTTLGGQKRGGGGWGGHTHTRFTEVVDY